MSWRPAQPFDGKQLQALAVAIWGASVGVFLTALLLLPGLKGLTNKAPIHVPGIAPVTILSPATVVPWQEVLEKRMYLLTCLCCPVLAWVALQLQSRLGGWSCALSFVLFIPAITTVYRAIFQSTPLTIPLVLAILALSVPWLGCASRTEWACTLATFVHQRCWKCISSIRSPLLDRLLLAICLEGLLFFFLFPLDVGTYASHFYQLAHIASYLVGPALSYLNPQSVPALDFESHYGIGHAYTFSYFLGNSLHCTLCHYIWFLFLTISFFYISTYFVLAAFFRCNSSALLMTLLLVAAGMEAPFFEAPSSSPIRYPLLFLFIGCASREHLFQRSQLPVLLAGGLAGLSLFWQTDIGVYLGIAGLVYYVTLAIRNRAGLARVPLFCVSASVTFALVALIAFGPRTLSWNFCRRLLDPLLVYKTGFGFWLMDWGGGWSNLYNIIGPVVTLATLALCFQRMGSGDAQQRQEAHFLFLCGVVGLQMLFKWVNRSIHPVWSLNAAAVLVILFWWVRYAAATLGQALETRIGSLPPGSLLSTRTLTTAAIYLALLGLGLSASLFQTRDPALGISSSPLLRIAGFISDTPTLANRILVTRTTPSPRTRGQLPIDRADVDLIRAHTDDTQPAPVLSSLDWVYLAEARRAPGFSWVPVHLTYTYRLLGKIETDLQRAQHLFVQRDLLPTLQTQHPALYSRVMPCLQHDFVLVGSGKALDLYQRTEK